jgi:hypothetical protein
MELGKKGEPISWLPRPVRPRVGNILLQLPKYCTPSFNEMKLIFRVWGVKRLMRLNYIRMVSNRLIFYSGGVQ